VAPFEIVVPLDRLATRDSDQRSWRAPTGTHRIRTGRFATDPDATTISIDL
jgi:hypothetical protein